MKVLFFSPHAFIGAHAIPEALVARSLLKSGNEVIYVGCDRAYKNNCISMSAVGVNFFSAEFDKNKICNECIARKNSISRKLNIESLNINDFMCDSDTNTILNLIDHVDKFNWHHYVYEDIPIGRYSAYEFILEYKINRLKLNDNEFLIYKDSLISAFRTLFAAKRIFNKFLPDKVVVYNSFYSIHNMFCSLAKNRGIDFYTIHAGSHLKDRLSMITIFRGNLSASLVARSKAWPVYRDNLLNKKRILKVHSHLQELFRARSAWVYSSKAKGIKPDQIRKILNISKSQKVILATLSSLDESFAGSIVDAIAEYDEPIFNTQNDWIDFLIEFAQCNPNVILIIRPHPREYPNKREGVRSNRSIELEEKFSKLPKNLIVNYPSQNIALHDLLRIVDLGLNTTSTTGIEFMLHGVPVINCDGGRILAYPNELHIVAKSRKDYVEKIQMVLKDGVKDPDLVLLYKWLSFLFEVVQIDIQDVFKIRQHNFFNRLFAFINRKLRIKNLLYGLNNNCLDDFKNQDWLRYAIENNEESCIDKRVESLIGQSPAISDIEAERYIKKLVKKLI